MTRKKFVKKIMAHKIQRNDAERIAELVNASGESYETMWNVFNVEAMNRALKKMMKMMEGVYYGQH